MTTVARSTASDKLYHGVYSAIVVEVGDPNHPGEVMLRFDWFDPQMRTEWCRICNLYAGNGYGSVWHPEQGDEVLVAFMHGDMRWPIVLGGLYNGQDAPPTTRSDGSNQKLLRTKGGHELLMDDSDNQKRLRLKTHAGHSIDLDDQGQKVVVTTSGGNQVTLDDGGAKVSVKTSGGQSITLQAGSITISATSVVIKATGVKLGGDAASQSLVLGEALMAAYNAHTHNCTAPGFPSGPPLSPMTPAVLSQVSKTA
jgi:uncharacterized protein involved in type VI secretion and phage assembly